MNTLSARAAIKMLQAGYLNHRHELMVLEAEKPEESEILVSAESVHMLRRAFSLAGGWHPPCWSALPRTHPFSFFNEVLIPSLQDLITSQRPHLQAASHWGLDPQPTSLGPQ